MARKRLTDASVSKIKPIAGKQITLFDETMRGLVLTISGGGTKSWSAMHYVDGKTRYHGLGRYPLVGLKEAREQAFDFLRNPQAAIAQANVKSFGTVADEFLKRHVEGKLRTEREIIRVLDYYVRPRWSDRPFEAIKRSDIRELLDTIEDENGARQADMVLAIVRKLMNWYATGHDDYTNPIVKGMGRVKASDRKRTRILSDDELRSVWSACGDLGTFGALTKMALLTAQRREKVTTMQWDDVIGGTWQIPLEAREKANAGTLRLPDQALAVLEAQPRIFGNPYVFAGRGKGPFNSWSQRKEELDAKILEERRKHDSDAKPLPHWTIHDLRRTARSLMSRAGVRPDIAERVLGHAIPGVEGVYDRHAYDEEKAQALKALASLLERIINPPADNVVPLERQA